MKKIEYTEEGRAILASRLFPHEESAHKWVNSKRFCGHDWLIMPGRSFWYAEVYHNGYSLGIITRITTEE